MNGQRRPDLRRRFSIGSALSAAHPRAGYVAAAIVLLVGLTAVSLLALLPSPPPPIISALLYLLFFALAAAVGGRVPGFIGVVAGTLLFDYLYIPPVFGLRPSAIETIGSGRTAGVVALLVFFLVAVFEVEVISRERSKTRRARILGNQMSVLASASDVLGESFDYQKTLEEVARLSATAFDGFCLIDLIEGHGRVSRVAAATSALQWNSLSDGLRRSPADLASSDNPINRVLRGGQSELVSKTDPAWLEPLAPRVKNGDPPESPRPVRPGSIMITPLIARERTIGALTLASTTPKRYGPADLEIAEDLAIRIALAIDNARLFEAETRARDEAMASLQRTRRLHSVATVLGQSLTKEAVAHEIAVQSCMALGADRAMIAELVDEGRTLEILASEGYREDLVEQWRRFPIEVPGPMSEAIRSRETVIVSSHQELLSRWPQLADPRRPPAGQANVTVPLVLDSQALGALTIGFPDERRLDASDIAFVTTLGRQCALALERARLLEAERISRREAEGAVARLGLVSRISELLAVSLDYPATYERLAALIVESLADLCLIDVLENGAAIARVAAVFADHEKQALADILRDRYPPPLDGPHPVAHVIRSGEPTFSAEMPDEFLRRFAQDDEHLRIIRELGFQSFMSVPLAARGRVLGAMTFVSTNPEHRYSLDDVGMAREIARRAAVRIDNTRLFQAEQQARVEAEEARENLQFLSEASRILSSSLDQDKTLRSVTRLIVPRLADWCAVQLVDDAGQIRTLEVAHVDPQKVAFAQRLQEEYPMDSGAPTGAPNVVRTGAPEIIHEIPDSMLDDLIPDPELLEIVRILGLRSSMVVPLVARGQVLGAITFVAAESGRLYDQEDLELAEELARRAGLAIDNARLYRERDYIAQTLQRSLLPPHLPRVPGVELAARYYPMTAGTEVGGDFYDVFDAGGGTWIVVIGDVCGKGPDAAAVMGVARHTIRASAMHERRPSSILQTMSDVLLSDVSDQRFCTACCARLRPGDGVARLTISSGGHPLPILVRAHGGTTRVGRHGTLLGVLPDPVLSDVAVDLQAGDAIVFFTDGLLDERHSSTTGSEARLIAVLSGCAGARVSEMAKVLDEHLGRVRGEQPRDDAAFLIVGVAR